MLKKVSSFAIFIGTLTLCLILSGLSFAEGKDQKAKVQAPLFNNLGAFHFKISTTVPLAQRFFDQGLTLYYGFEWGESTRSFREAARLDPNCAMCYWGVALTLGSKLNAPITGKEYPDAKTAIAKALLLKSYTTPVEQAYIQALALRFQHQPKKIIPSNEAMGAFNCHTLSTVFDTSSKKEILNYAQAMKKVTGKYPTDNNAKALYAYALFESIGWEFAQPNGKLNPVTPKIIAVLQSALATDKLHIGANHYYVHVIESLAKPERALDSANRLRTLVPGSEHLMHMPSHIYFRIGDYHGASTSNIQAIKTFKQYNEDCRKQGFNPEINYLYFHNYDFLRSSAAMEGRKQLALSAVREMRQQPFPTWLKNESSLQWFIPIPYFVEARFGLWNDILKEGAPQEKYQYALGMWHYARGMALANTGKVKDAEYESNALKQIIKKGPSNNVLQKDGIVLLKIAEALLNAAIADKHHNEKAMLTYLKAADKMEQEKRYHEPPDWYFPIKEALGYAYLKWNHPQQAIAMFQQDLKQYPKNGWALFGLAKGLRQIGKNKEADHVDKEFKEAWQYADIPNPGAIY